MKKSTEYALGPSLRFYKYQAAGNDFVVIDNRVSRYKPTPEWIKKVCARRWGIGADGMVMLEEHPDVDFTVVYYNPDGSQSLCGNGCRAAVDLAKRLNMVTCRASFSAFDGRHEATILKDKNIQITMRDVAAVTRHGEDVGLDTGSPHYVRFVSSLDDHDVEGEGRKIRFDIARCPDGANVNFVSLGPNQQISLRTYERGVEAETLSCATGAVAAVLAAALRGYTSPVSVQTRGGMITVAFNGKPEGAFCDITITGPAEPVFEGVLIAEPQSAGNP